MAARGSCCTAAASEARSGRGGGGSRGSRTRAARGVTVPGARGTSRKERLRPSRSAPRGSSGTLGGQEERSRARSCGSYRTRRRARRCEARDNPRTWRDPRWRWRAPRHGTSHNLLWLGAADAVGPGDSFHTLDALSNDPRSRLAFRGILRTRGGRTSRVRNRGGRDSSCTPRPHETPSPSAPLGGKSCRQPRARADD